MSHIHVWVCVKLFPGPRTATLPQACQITLRKMEGGIHGLDFSVTAHTEVDGNETIHEPDIGGCQCM